MLSPVFAQSMVRSVSSGLHPKLRPGARLMILQACIDDSGSHPRRTERLFLLGGLIATLDQWAAFTLEWADALKKPPGLDYFKMSQALSLKDEFSPAKGWTESLRDQRVLALAEIVRKYVELPIFIWMSRSDYERLVVPFAHQPDVREPYFMLFHHMTELISRHAPLFPGMQHLQYIFDEQGEIGKRAIDFWDLLASATKQSGAYELLGSTPLPMDDKKFLPLQAADLYAGVSRNDLEGNHTQLVADACRIFSNSRHQPIAAEYTRDNMLSLSALMIVRRSGFCS